MADHAIVIGIDSHADAAWQLTAAVRDALAFAHWVTEPDAGRATPETLTLLLSPNADATLDTQLAYQPATQANIQNALFAYSNEDAGNPADRLWFYYAGHGIAPQGGGVDAAPIIIPADVASLGKYLTFGPLALSSFLSRMQIARPVEQVYFIDACRGIVDPEDVATSTQSLHFDLSKLSDVAAAQAKQVVLYATTSGQLANEYKAHGLFSGTLLEGLRGRGTSLEPDPATLGFVLTFDALSSFTRRVIAKKSEEAVKNERLLPTQEPATDLFRAEGAFAIARFATEPGVDLKVFVEPVAARTGGSAWIKTYDRTTREWVRALPVEPALPEPLRWSLPSGAHRVEIEAPGYAAWLQVVDLLGDQTLRATMDVDAGLESFGPSAGTDDLANGEFGTLIVDAQDRYARIEVFDDAGVRLAAAWESFEQLLPVGRYRVEVLLPTESTVVETVLLTTGETRVTRRPMSTLPPTVEQDLQAIDAHTGASEPSEVFGRATTTRLGSVLAWAAWAARFPRDGHGQKLRTIGVTPFDGDTTFPYIQVLVADARATAGIPGLTVAFGPTGGELPVPVDPVPALSTLAAQWHGQVMTGPHSVTVSFDGLQQKAFPLAALPGWVDVIVVAREASGAIEIHRYLNPVAPDEWFSDRIRRIEQNWRALDSRTPLFPGEADALLAAPLDPLSLAVLGYRLAREGNLALLAPRMNELAEGGLADGRILAALALSDEDFPYGVPLVGEGFRALQEWLLARAARDNAPPPTTERPFTDGVWTTFDPQSQRVDSRAFSVDAAPAWAASLRPIAEVTGRLEPTDGRQSFTGTTFVVGPGVVAAAAFSLLGDVEPSSWKVAFASEDAGSPVEQVIAEAQSQPIVLLRIQGGPEHVPALSWTLPYLGQRIAVIGHPALDGRLPEAHVASQFTCVPNGSKVVMPGVVVEVKPDRVTYECWTMGGVAGGPVIDLDSGRVIAVHTAGKFEGGRKLAWGTPLAALVDDPMWAAAGITPERGSDH